MQLTAIETYLKGTLSVLEFDGLPFVPKRMFYVSGVPAGEVRGCHAHYVTEQYLICVQGQILVELYDGQTSYNELLFPGHAVMVPRMIWDQQMFITGDDVMLAVCSTSYNPRDYIEDIEEFRRLKREAVAD